MGEFDGMSRREFIAKAQPGHTAAGVNFIAGRANLANAYPVPFPQTMPVQEAGPPF